MLAQPSMMANKQLQCCFRAKHGFNLPPQHEAELSTARHRSHSQLCRCCAQGSKQCAVARGHGRLSTAEASTCQLNCSNTSVLVVVQAAKQPPAGQASARASASVRVNNAQTIAEAFRPAADTGQADYSAVPPQRCVGCCLPASDA